MQIWPQYDGTDFNCCLVCSGAAKVHVNGAENKLIIGADYLYYMFKLYMCLYKTNNCMVIII